MEGGASVKRSWTADEAVETFEEKALQSPNSPLPVDADSESTELIFKTLIKGYRMSVLYKARYCFLL